MGASPLIGSQVSSFSKASQVCFRPPGAQFATWRSYFCWEKISSSKGSQLLKMFWSTHWLNCTPPANTIAVSPGFRSDAITFLNDTIFSDSSSTWTVCLMLVFVARPLFVSWDIPPTCIFIAWRVKSNELFCTSFGHVAVKNKVCLASPAKTSCDVAEPGQFAMICRISGSKPMSSMRSASSKTKYITESTKQTGAWKLHAASKQGYA